MEKAVNLLSPLCHGETTESFKKKKLEVILPVFSLPGGLIWIWGNEVLRGVLFLEHFSTFVLFSGACMVNPIAR